MQIFSFVSIAAPDKKKTMAQDVGDGEVLERFGMVLQVTILNGKEV